MRSDRFAYILNLTPEATFKCMSTHPKRDWWASWKEKAATDEFARGQVERYQHRPGEELYDIVSDPFQTRNLADDPKYAGEKAALRAKLLQWMERQGDRGQETEMEAKEHMFHKEADDTPRPKKKKPEKRDHKMPGLINFADKEPKNRPMKRNFIALCTLLLAACGSQEPKNHPV